MARAAVRARAVSGQRRVARVRCARRRRAAIVQPAPLDAAGLRRPGARPAPLGDGRAAAQLAGQRRGSSPSCREAGSSGSRRISCSALLPWHHDLRSPAPGSCHVATAVGHVFVARSGQNELTGGMARRSAGILLYRRTPTGVEVLLVHPGGPFWAAQGRRRVVDPQGRARRRRGAAGVRAARVRRGDRHDAPDGRARPPRRGRGRRAARWWRPGRPRATSTPRRSAATRSSSSGRRARAAAQEFPEVDRAGWFGLAEAREKLLPAQARVRRPARAPRSDLSGSTRGGTRTHTPSRAAAFKPPAVPVRLPGRAVIVRPAGRILTSPEAAATLKPSNLSAPAGFSRTEPFPRPSWKSPHSSTPASPASRALAAAAPAARRAPDRAHPARQPPRLRGAGEPLPGAPARLLPPHADQPRGRGGRAAGGLRRRLQRDRGRRAADQRAAVALPDRAQPLAQPPAQGAGHRRRLDGRPPLRARPDDRRQGAQARGVPAADGDVGDLPETQRTALLLREIDALSYEQIAEAMETTVPSVKSLLVRARVGAGRGGRGAAAHLRGGARGARRGRRGPAPHVAAGAPPPAHLRALPALPQAAAPDEPRAGRGASRSGRCCCSRRRCSRTSARRRRPAAARPRRPPAARAPRRPGPPRRRARRPARARWPPRPWPASRRRRSSPPAPSRSSTSGTAGADGKAPPPQRPSAARRRAVAAAARDAEPVAVASARRSPSPSRRRRRTPAGSRRRRPKAAPRRPKAEAHRRRPRRRTPAPVRRRRRPRRRADARRRPSPQPRAPHGAAADRPVAGSAERRHRRRCRRDRARRGDAPTPGRLRSPQPAPADADARRRRPRPTPAPQRRRPPRGAGAAADARARRASVDARPERHVDVAAPAGSRAPPRRSPRGTAPRT